MRKTMIRAAALAAALGAAGEVRAQGVPVIDSSAIAQLVQQFQQLQQDYAVQIDQLEKLLEQYVMLQQQYAAVTGPRGIGGLINAAEDIRDRSAADTLQGILDGSVSGDLSALTGNVSRITARIEDLREEYDFGEIGALVGSENASDRAIASSAGAGMAAIATADDTYARSNQSTARVNALIGEIDATPDIKASTDLNTRMLAEVAVLLNETLRVQAAAANAQGAETLSNARAQAAQRRFMQVGD
jgi:hypothetical protein